MLDDHLKRFEGLLNSSIGKSIVVTQGNTGAGKTTLLNLLCGRNLLVNQDGDIVPEK